MHMSVWLYVLVLSFQLVCGRNSNSPCPGIFKFEAEEDDVYGKITVKPEGCEEPVSLLNIRINYTVVNRTTKDRGRIEPLGSKLLRTYNDGQAVKYRVHFPVISPLPKVTAIIVNGDIICEGPGVLSGRRKRISRISLSHTTSFSTSADKPVKPRPVYESVMTTPAQNNNFPTSRPVVTASLYNRFINTPITTDECGVVASSNEIPLIYHGNVYERGEIPWLVAIYRVVERTLRFICGGTLVSDRHVVTAAHCMQRSFSLTPKEEIIVKLGVHKLNDWSDDLTVTRNLMAATIHEEYNPYTLQNDILILTLNKRVVFNRYIRPACVWSGDTELSRVVGATGVVAGWGDLSVDDVKGKNDLPQMVRVPIVSTKECRASKSDFHRLTYNTTLCAGDRNGGGPCQGDSGGGLYLLEGGKWRLRGIVSLSLPNSALTCDLSEYVVFTDAAQFLPWLRNILSTKYFD